MTNQTPNRNGLKAIALLRKRYRFDASIERLIGCGQAGVHYWVRNGGWIGQKYVARVSELTKIPPHKLRPDLYPEGTSAVEELEARIAELEAENAQLKSRQTSMQAAA